MGPKNPGASPSPPKYVHIMTAIVYYCTEYRSTILSLLAI